MRIVLGLLQGDEQVAVTGAALRAQGVEGRVRILDRPEAAWQYLEAHYKTPVVLRHIGLGVAAGVGIALVYGLPVGVLLCRLRDCPLANAALMLALVTLFWAVAGGFTGYLAGVGRVEQEYDAYVEGVCCGGRLVAVETPSAHASTVAGTLMADRATLVDVI